MFDISKLAVTETAAIHLKDPAGELLFADAERTLPVRIHIYGPGSKPFGLLEARQSARVVKRMQENDGRVTVAPFEERAREAAEDLAAITFRLENLSYSPAGDVEGLDLYTALYADPKLGFIVKQVTKFVGDWGNFKAA